MMKMDLIVAVNDIHTSSKWYQTLLGCKSMHDGSHFDILVDEQNEVLLCLHKWGEHDHPTMQNPQLKPGNGLILYLRTDNMSKMRETANEMGCYIEEDVHLNKNSNHQEFSLRDPDGYYLTITEYHEYEG